jgi:hypothetical protein
MSDGHFNYKQVQEAEVTIGYNHVPANLNYKESWESHITPDGLVPIDIVHHLMIENEELKQALFEKNNSKINRLFEMLNYSLGNSISDVKQNISMLAHKSGMANQSVYSILYGAMERSRLQKSIFKGRPMGESKIHWLWSLGYLPFLSIMVDLLEMLLSELCRIDRQILNKIKNANGKQTATRKTSLHKVCKTWTRDP